MPKAPPSILSPKNDFVFKVLFGDSDRIAPLADFLQAAIPLPADEFAGLTLIDPNRKRRFKGDKQPVLDVCIKTRSGREIDVEIQVERTEELCDRIQYYTSRMVTEQVKSGQVYMGMPQSITIVILDYPLWKMDKRYHHRFRLYDVEAELEYPNSMEIHTLELPKRPASSDGSGLWNWLTFLSSKTEKEFKSLERKGGAMAEAVARLMEMSADEEMRRQAVAREKWLWDQAARVRTGRREGEAIGMAKGKAEGIAETARRMLRMKMSLTDIAKATELSKAEIKRLAAEEKA